MTKINLKKTPNMGIKKEQKEKKIEITCGLTMFQLHSTDKLW